MRILLVEDDEVLTSVLLTSLEQQRYVVDTVDDGRFGLEYAEGDTYDLLLLDVGLPRLDGISLCQQLRNNGCTTPILLMTAKDAPDEKIRGLDAGADDYLTKPLDLAELHARLRALLRRGEVSASSVLEVGQLRLDPVSCEVTYTGNLLKLTPKEYSLLELFLRNPTRVFSRGHIVEHLWTFDDPPLEDSVKAHIKGLRRRLKKAGADGWIENVYGLGYKLSPKNDEAPPPEQAASSPSDPTPTTEAALEQQFQQAMAGLWQQHQGTMTDRLSALQQAQSALQQGQLTDDLQQSAAQAAHKLAGVLGMFGRDDGTQVARALETTLSEIQLTAITPEQVTPLVKKLTDILTLTEKEFSPSPNAPLTPSPPLPTPPAAERSRSPTILAVDDDPLFLSSLPALLNPWGMTVTTLSDPTQFWETLNATNPDLLILDIEMPERDGIELCQAVRDDDRWQSLPVLFLTGRQNAAGQVFAVGADDYVVKPVVGPELVVRITNRLERVQLLKTLRDRDPITGLANQAQAQRVLQALMESDRPYTFALLKLTNLAQINLEHGHPTGYQVLKAWVSDLRTFLSDALLSYWGNGEFVIALPNVAKADAQEMLSPVLKAFRQRVFTESGSEAARFQAQYAVGLSAFPADGKTLSALYQEAYAAGGLS